MTHLLPFPGLPVRPVLFGPEEPDTLPVVAGVLHVGLVLDDVDGPRRVTQEDLGAWGASTASLLALALNRLALGSDADRWVPVEAVPGLAIYQAEDGESASRLLVIDQLISAWPLGGVVVGIPASNQLFAVTLETLDDLDALNVLVVATQFAYEAADQPLTDRVFWTDGRRWLPVAVRHTDDDEVVVELPDAAQAALGRLAALGFAAVAGEA